MYLQRRSLRLGHRQECPAERISASLAGFFYVNMSLLLYVEIEQNVDN